MANYQHTRGDPVPDDYDYFYDYDSYNNNDHATEPDTTAPFTPQRQATTTTTSGSLFTNALNRLQASLSTRISPSRTVHTNLATVPEASEEGSDRQSVITTSTADTVRPSEISLS